MCVAAGCGRDEVRSLQWQEARLRRTLKTSLLSKTVGGGVTLRQTKSPASGRMSVPPPTPPRTEKQRPDAERQQPQKVEVEQQQPQQQQEEEEEEQEGGYRPETGPWEGPQRTSSVIILSADGAGGMLV